MPMHNQAIWLDGRLLIHVLHAADSSRTRIFSFMRWPAGYADEPSGAIGRRSCQRGSPEAHRADILIITARNALHAVRLRHTAARGQVRITTTAALCTIIEGVCLLKLQPKPSRQPRSFQALRTVWNDELGHLAMAFSPERICARAVGPPLWTFHSSKIVVKTLHVTAVRCGVSRATPERARQTQVFAKPAARPLRPAPRRRPPPPIRVPAARPTQL